MKHIKTITPLIEEIIAIRKDNAKLILNLQDEQKEKCFTINSSELDSNLTLSPEYYNFNHQYKVFASKLQTIPIEKTMEWLANTLQKKSFRINNKHLFILHPEVVKNIEQVLYL